MNTLKTMEALESRQKYLLRVNNGRIEFVPINADPLVRNCYLLETCTTYKFDTKSNQFLEARVTGILLTKREDVTQKLEGFKSKSLSTLLEKVSSNVMNKYLGLS